MLIIIGIVIAILCSVIVIILLTQKPVDLKISNIDITAIRDSIIEQQLLEVDAVTSAAYSSNTIRKAIENALQQGEE